jgi:hypothetical protein
MTTATPGTILSASTPKVNCTLDMFWVDKRCGTLQIEMLWIELTWFVILHVRELCLFHIVFFYLNDPQHCALQNMAPVSLIVFIFRHEQIKRGVFNRQQMEIKGPKQEGTNWICPIRISFVDKFFCYRLQQCALMNLAMLHYIYPISIL